MIKNFNLQIDLFDIILQLIKFIKKLIHFLKFEFISFLFASIIFNLGFKTLYLLFSLHFFYSYQNEILYLLFLFKILC